MTIKKSKGFTIIELLVVVAIIAVLAAIVLFNVTAFITKGKVAAGKGNLAGLQIDGAVDYEAVGNYDGFCAARFALGRPRYDAVINADWTALGCSCDTAGCAPTATQWCAIGTEVGSTTRFCIDSTGAKIESTTVTCPAAGICT